MIRMMKKVIKKIKCEENIAKEVGKNKDKIKRERQ